jgi:hypothetical protein
MIVEIENVAGALGEKPTKSLSAGGKEVPDADA